MTNPGKAGSRTPAHVLSKDDLRILIYRNKHRGRYLFNIVAGRNYMANGVLKLGSSLGEVDLEPMRVLLAKAAEWIATQPREVQSEG